MEKDAVNCSLPINSDYDSITDEMIIALFKAKLDDNLVVEDLVGPKFPFTIGYMVEMRNRLNGLVMSGLVDRPIDGDMKLKFFYLCLQYTSEVTEILRAWTPKEFLRIGNEYARTSNAMSDHAQRHYLGVRRPENELPDHFSDFDMCLALETAVPSSVFALPSEICTFEGKQLTLRNRYPLSCGLVIKARTGLLRMVKRSYYRLADITSVPENAQLADLLYRIARHFTIDDAVLVEHWTPRALYCASLELACKSINIPANLQRTLNSMSLQRLSCMEGTCECSNFQSVGIADWSSASLESETVGLHFDKELLCQVAEYHEKTSRPEGTFDSATDDSMEHEFLSTLSQLPRDTCPKCLGRRQVYCGNCVGLRMPNAQELLPPRIDLPFDILLLLHWHETLHKCTGVQAGALISATVDVVEWPRVKDDKDDKEDHEALSGDVPSEMEHTGVVQSRLPKFSDTAIEPVWGSIASSLDCNRDVLLFPGDQSVDAEVFPWRFGAELSASECSSLSTLEHKKKWRLVVIEASWYYGKSLYRKITKYRACQGLPPLRCVRLADVVGGYWKFHDEGHSAVSSIEAIAHTAHAAGLSEADTHALLLLFRLQKYRVLDRVKSGGKPPKAVCVTGSGLGSWSAVTSADS